MLETCVRHGVQPDRLEVIPNWADVQSLRPIKEGNVFRKHHGLDGKFVVMYSGNMGVPHLLTPMLDVAEQFRSEDSVVFYFVGGGVQKTPIEAEAARRGLMHVRVLPYQPKAELSQSLSAADVQLVSVKPGVIACLMPSKVYGILAAGCAVLAIAPRTSELGEMVLDNQFGAVCEPESPTLVADLVAAIRRLRANADPTLPARTHDFVVRTAAKDPQVAKFRNLFLRLVGDANRTAAGQGTEEHSSSREAAVTAR
jgi:glycosyltransferase involved in cell wall biosynthesis